MASNRIEIQTIKSSIKSRGMWAGGQHKESAKDMFGLSNTYCITPMISAYHTPALFKIIDEIIVNAVDNVQNGTRNIDIVFNNDMIIVKNDGPGIKIETVIFSGEKMYTPEIAFSIPLSGSNTAKDVTSIKGGINGLGAKIANFNSKVFIVTTLDGTFRFYQKWEDGGEKIMDRSVTADVSAPFTIVAFTPMYDKYGYTYPLDSTSVTDISNWLRLRVVQCNCYLKSKAVVRYNAEDYVDIHLSNLVSRSGTDIVKTVTVNNGTYSWELSAIISQSARSGMKDMCVVNGVVSNKGAHIKYIKDALKKVLGDDSSVLVFMKIALTGTIPGADWTGQNKDTLTAPPNIISQFIIPPAWINDVANILRTKKRTTITKKEKTDLLKDSKYSKALYAGKKGYKEKTALFVTEGDSASGTVRIGLSSMEHASYWYGVITSGGVTMNSLKTSTETVNEEGETIIICNERLRENKKLAAIAEAFGLDYSKKYDTAEEMNTLNYGRLIICVDQDLDGTGKIASLILLWLFRFWPALFKNERIYRFLTPLMRIYKNRTIVEEFYYTNEYNEWLKGLPLTEHNNIVTKYYKGLATHNKLEIIRMFSSSQFYSGIYKFVVDADTEKRFEVYYGKDTSIRKQELSTTVLELPNELIALMKQLQMIPLGTVQLNHDTKLFKLSGIKRQIPHILDGLNPSRRKVIMTIRDKGEVKVSQLSGYTTAEMHYEHGESSIEEIIKHMGQSFVGGRKYPLLVGIGNFGNRHGDPAGASRYIHVSPSKLIDALYPRDDMWLLPYEFEENERVEPQYMIPVLPMAILETFQIPSEGWSHTCYARDITNVVALIGRYLSLDQYIHDAVNEVIQTGQTNKQFEWLPINSTDYTGPIVIENDIEYSYGTFQWQNDKVVHISELPMNEKTINYINMLRDDKAHIVNDVEHILTMGPDLKETVSLMVHLNPDELEIQKKKGDINDVLINTLRLKKSLKPNLNFYTDKQQILSCGNNYILPVLYWLDFRRKLYHSRLLRQQAILEMKIIEEQNIVRYISLVNELNINTKQDEADLINLLQLHKFVKLDSTLLHSPKYTSVDTYREVVKNGPKASYDYLLNLKTRELVISAVTKRDKKISNLCIEMAKIDELLKEPIPGASLWLEEIKKCVTIMLG